jgi:hypothetical protein
MRPLLSFLLARRRNRGARGRCPCRAIFFEELGKGIAESGALSFARPEGRAPSFYFRTRVWTISPVLHPVRLAAQARPFTGKGIVIHFTTARPTRKAEASFRARESRPATPGAGLCRFASQPSAATRTDHQPLPHV